MTATRHSGPHVSYLARAFEFGRAGAPPLAFRAVDLRERPDHPDHRFNITVERGEIVAVVGDEDSGVGDLGKYALGLAEPPAGQIEVFGAAIADLPYYDLLVFRRRIGYLQLGDGLLQNLSLRDNIALPLRFASDHQVAVVEDRVTQLVGDLHLRSVVSLRPAQANEEDRRRAAVARALTLDPDLVVMEAPFDGLTGRAAVDLLEQASRCDDGSRRAIFLTAQDLVPAVRRLITRVVRVVDGEAVDDAP